LKDAEKEEKKQTNIEVQEIDNSQTAGEEQQ
jgi:hypothetical protein